MAIYYSTGVSKHLPKKGKRVICNEETGGRMLMKGFVTESFTNNKSIQEKEPETDVLQEQNVAEESTQEKEPEYSVKLIKPEKPEKTPKAKPKAKPVKRGRKK